MSLRLTGVYGAARKALPPQTCVHAGRPGERQQGRGRCKERPEDPAEPAGTLLGAAGTKLSFRCWHGRPATLRRG